jgi:superfamily II DNA or RNA helicase
VSVELPETAKVVSSTESARTLVADAASLRKSGRAALGAASERRKSARKAYERARDDAASRQLATMPIARLRETTLSGVRLGAIEKAGYTTVGSILKTSPQRLMQIKGVGQHSAVQVIAAARQLEQAMKEGLHFRFDVDRRPKEQTALLETLADLDAAERAVRPLRNDLEPLVASLDALVKPAKRARSRLRMFFSRRSKREEATRAVAQLEQLLSEPRAGAVRERLDTALAEIDAKRPRVDVWRDYEARTATFNGLLINVGELGPDQDASEGFIPSDLAQRVHEHPLDTSLLNVSLRGYQAFGAKFALVQKRAMLGDEMGLGKTIEALAAICHVSAKGDRHFLVICPASVLVNWLHEIERHTDLAAVRLHGSDRISNFKVWSQRGGVGVTTFQSLRWLYERDFDFSPAMVVVDEAHYVKNPVAQRTVAVRDFMQYSERALFLTGTPMENRVDEFRVLVEHLQPDVARKVSSLDGLAGAARFRAAVAPVYLRRNQSDVLQELPERIETQEWVDLFGEDLAAYRDAVVAGNFMAMRQAAYAPGNVSGSAKLARLVEIAEEAMSNGRKVVVFSFFRGVLDTVASALAGAAMGPLTGSVPPTKRQKLVDEFTSAPQPRVLVSQIEAGGVGLNIQAASVVILTEPQWKPTIEDQAIARCHRMGQARVVDVHRLLAENSVDQRMLEILAGKSALFDEYVRRSELKEISADAVDISDLETTRETVSQAETERRIIELERRQMGIEPEGADDGPVVDSAST